MKEKSQNSNSKESQKKKTLDDYTQEELEQLPAEEWLKVMMGQVLDNLNNE